jgi:hypothetical protein
MSRRRPHLHHRPAAPGAGGSSSSQATARRRSSSNCSRHLRRQRRHGDVGRTLTAIGQWVSEQNDENLRPPAPARRQPSKRATISQLGGLFLTAARWWRRGWAEDLVATRPTTPTMPASTSTHDDAVEVAEAINDIVDAHRPARRRSA